MPKKLPRFQVNDKPAERAAAKTDRTFNRA